MLDPEGTTSTPALNVAISTPPVQDPDEWDGATFNVIVIYESTPARWREDGTAYADWTVILDRGSTEGGEA